MKISRISIVGGGIGGLTAALALQHFGYRVAVFEQAQELREIGAGVHFWVKEPASPSRTL